MTSEIIKLDNVSKSYRDKRLRRVQAVKDVTFSVHEGEAFGFVGPNGAGKSTTMKILTGVIRADEGKAELLGFPVEDFRSRRGMGYVPENPYLYDYLTPLEVLMMGARFHGVDGVDLKRHCMGWLERFDVAHAATRRIRTFSKGMTQRTALAHALACKPRLLILDEPLSGLDPIGRKDVVDILLEYRRGGGSVFFSSHVLHDVERLADRFGMIHKGQLRSVRTPSELTGDATVNQVLTITGNVQWDGPTQEGDGKWRWEVPHADLWAALDKVRSSGCELVEIKRGGLSLEQAFLAVVREGA